MIPHKGEVVVEQLVYCRPRAGGDPGIFVNKDFEAFSGITIQAAISNLAGSSGIYE
jgi:hypothetical protein